MIKKVRTEDAIGQPLLHDITGILAGGFKGVMFKRNHVISKDDIETLKNIGKDHIYVGELSPDQVHEDDAAIALAPLVSGDNIKFDSPSEGKISLSSSVDGLLLVNTEALDGINSVGDYTIASLPNYMEVNEGQKLAGLRIVPLWTSKEIVENAIEITRTHGKIFNVLPYRKLKVGIVITGSEIFHGRIKDLFEPIVTPKIERFGGEIIGVEKCPDDLDIIMNTATKFLNSGAELIVFSGGMSVDPDDLTPTAIRELSDSFINQGVPLQPGNMLTIGYKGNCVLVGVPGASIHAPVTSFDVVLPRIFAGLKIVAEDLTILGDGGLCMNCKPCHYPICFFGR